MISPINSLEKLSIVSLDGERCLTVKSCLVFLLTTVVHRGHFRHMVDSKPDCFRTKQRKIVGLLVTCVDVMRFYHLETEYENRGMALNFRSVVKSFQDPQPCVFRPNSGRVEDRFRRLDVRSLPLSSFWHTDRQMRWECGFLGSVYPA